MVPLSAARAAEVSVLHAEPIVLADADGVVADGRKLAQRSKGGRSSFRFTAYGRRFDLALQSHSQLNEFAARRGAAAIALRGELAGVENSWVRLTQVGDDVQGLIWDGRELYAVEPARVVQGGDSAGTVIFRLRDTLTPAGTHSCAVDEASGSGAEYFTKMQSEISATFDKTDGASSRLLVSAVIDTAFRAQYANDQAAIDALLARLNNVDGIFASQLGVTIELSDAELATSTIAQRLTSSTNANQLLTSLSKARLSDANLLGSGITHLFTGRDLDGATIGISYIGAVCSSSYGATLSEARGRGAWLDSLIAAHEFGHSFGATHDGTEECSATPATFLMAPTIDGWDQFSQCSVNRIKSKIAQAGCLVPVQKADVIVAENLGSHSATINQEFYWGLSIANLGSPITQTVSAKIIVPASVQIIGAVVPNGSCSVGGGMADCVLDAMTPQEVRRIELRLRGTLTGSYAISAEVDAASDLDVGNNRGNGTLVIDEAATTPATNPPTTAPTTNAPSTAEGGGGGSLTWPLLLVLGLIRLSSRRR